MVKSAMMAGGTVSALALGNEFLFPQRVLSAEAEFLGSSHTAKRPIKKKILIAYATFCGTTASVAQAIGSVLGEQGAQVEVRLLKNVNDLSSYDGAVVGSSVRSASWLPEAVAFVEKNKVSLKGIPVAYFLTCLALFKENEESRKVARSYLNPALKAAPAVQPVDMGFFAGVLDYSKLNMIYRTIMKSKMKDKGVPEGDFRNWGAIQAWARGLGSPLLGT